MSGRTRLIVVLSMLFVGGLGLVLSVGATLYSCGWRMGISLCSCDWTGFFLNLGTELIGAVAIYSLFELFVERRERIESEKARLIAELGSSVKDIAVAAAEKLMQRGWLRDGSLHGAYLARANLEGVLLRGANLDGVNLSLVNLGKANLEGANLEGANLVEAILGGGKLRKAWLENANLGGVFLGGANLEGAFLLNANLGGANLGGATLPDGTEWTPDTDMARFTNPEHLDFWRSDDPGSPAYRSKDSD